MGVIISLACGAVLDLKICAYPGKGTGEVSLLRRLWSLCRTGDVYNGSRFVFEIN